MLKALAGITSFDGDIILNDRLNIKKQPVAYRSVVNFAEAEPIFPEFLTGSELIQLFKAAKNAPNQQEDFYLESMHMTSYIDEPVNTYSSGMLKKLSLVLAFLGWPTCILLDEPLTTLDAESLPILYSWISSQCQQQETTVLLSSHQAFEGGGFCRLFGKYSLSITRSGITHEKAPDPSVSQRSGQRFLPGAYRLIANLI